MIFTRISLSQKQVYISENKWDKNYTLITQNVLYEVM